MSLIEELAAIATQCNPRQMIADRRAQACDEALKEITNDFSEKAKEAQRNGRTQTKLIEWSFEENRRYHECYLLDLLSKGDLLRRLQNWFDDVHGQGNFKVYYTVPTPRHQEMAVYASWDKTRFEEISDRLAKLKEHQEKRQVNGEPLSQDLSVPQRGARRDFRSSDQPRERRDFPQRGFRSQEPSQEGPRGRGQGRGRGRGDFRPRAGIPVDRLKSPSSRQSSRTVPFKGSSNIDPMTVLNDKTASFDFGDQ